MLSMLCEGVYQHNVYVAVYFSDISSGYKGKRIVVKTRDVITDLRLMECLSCLSSSWWGRYCIENSGECCFTMVISLWMSGRDCNCTYI